MINEESNWLLLVRFLGTLVYILVSLMLFWESVKTSPNRWKKHIQHESCRKEIDNNTNDFFSLSYLVLKIGYKILQVFLLMLFFNIINTILFNEDLQ